MPQDLGLWQYIGVTLAYFSIPIAPVGFWVTRLIARGEKLYKTTLYIAAVMAVTATVVYILLSGYMALASESAQFYFLLASFQLPALFILGALEAIAAGSRPYIIHYGYIVHEVVKLPLALFLVVSLGFGLRGAIMTVILAFYIRSVFLGWMLHDLFKDSFSRRHISMMFKHYWLPAYSMLASKAFSLDVVIVAALLSTTTPIGYVAAAGLIGNIVGFTSSLAAGLYPRLLHGGSSDDVSTSIKMVLMFAVPILIGSVILAEPLLNVLRPEYAGASLTLIIIAVSSFFGCFTSISDAVISGTEKIDNAVGASFKDYVKSKLFLLPTLTCANVALYFSSIYVVLNIIRPAEAIDVSLAWVSVGFLSGLPFAVYKWILARRILSFKIPFKRSLLKYLIASIPMAVIAYVLKPVVLKRELGSALMDISSPILLGASAFFITLYFIDPEFRLITRLIIAEIRRMFSRSRLE